MRTLAYLILAVGLVGWMIPFVRRQQQSVPAATIDRRARWGILLIGISFGLLWQGRYWTRSTALWQIVLGISFFALASALSWTSTLALGRQWRLDAGLNADHELVRSGPYRIIRHPIYASMFCALIATGSVLSTPLVLFIPSLIFCGLGTAIRVRVEDRLLAQKFGVVFQDYRRRVPLLIPFTKGWF